jgi:hypothetical protein
VESRAELPLERWAGWVLHRAGPALAGFAALVGLLAAALVPVGGWRPLVVLPLLVVGAAAVLLLSLRVPTRAAPVWTAAGVLAVVAGHVVWAAATHAEQVVLRRDPGSYALFAQWIATRHGLPIDPQAGLFGGRSGIDDAAFTVGSPAYYEVPTADGAQVVPQFLLGAPALYSVGYWLHGWTGLFVAPAVVGGAAILAVAGLAARISGPRSAPLAAAALALSQPVLHAARSTYSEPAALLLVTAAAALLVDACRVAAETAGPAPAGPAADGWRRSARLAAAAGAGFGLAGLVRVDALREVVLLLPVAALLAMRPPAGLDRHPVARPLVLGAAVATALAAVPAMGLSRPYLTDIAASLLPLVALGVLLGGGSLVAVRAARRPGSPPAVVARRVAAGLAAARLPAPVLLPGLLGLTAVLLASRPLWQTVRQEPNDPGSKAVAGLQLRQGLPVDGGRTYAEHSLAWVSWYVGPLTLLAALAALLVAAHQVGRWWAAPQDAGGPAAPAWLGPALVGTGSTVLSLYRPGITPDHPWADRRLVPVVLPLVLLAAVALLARLTSLARARWSAGLFVAVPVAGTVALLVPVWLGTAGVAVERTELGEPAAGRQLCARLRPGDVVVGVDTRARNEWPQLVRGLCGHPAASFAGPPSLLPQAVPRVLARIRAAGRTPVLIAANDASSLTALGLTAEPVVRLRTTEDARPLTRRPDGVDPLDVDLWLARP